MDQTENGQLDDVSCDSDVIDLEGELSSTDSNNDEEDKESIESERDMNLDEEMPEENGQPENNNAEANIEEENAVNEEAPKEINDEHSWTVLGEHRFVEKKMLSSAPSWAENPTTFDARIKSRVGKGIKLIEGLDQQFFESLSEKISVWFPVQMAVLPKLLDDNPSHDIAISAPTGSGKTLCYLIPILNRVLQGWKSKYIMSIVLAPTKTLIRQIAKEFNRFNSVDAKIVVLSDGSSYADERKALFANGSNKARAHVIISTPQRLVEHLIDRSGTINLKRLRYLVVDEADAMKFVREEWLGMLERAANYPTMHNSTSNNDDHNTQLQKILVSATLSLEADKLHDWNLRSPCLYRATPKRVIDKTPKQENGQTEEITSKKLYNVPTSDVGRLTLPEDLTQELKICDMQFKPLLIYGYLAKNPDWRKVLVFVNSVDTSRRLTILLTHLFESERRISEISSNLHARRRLKELKRVTEAENCVVICSDTVGRGIDIADLDAVFNYEVPKNAKVFLHRAGRAARAGRSGHVVTLATKEEKLGLKRELISVDIWNAEAENREKDVDFVKRYEKKYKKALTALKQELEVSNPGKSFKKKSKPWKRR